MHLTKLEGPTWYSVNILSMEQRQKIVDHVMDNTQKPLTPQYEKLISLYQQSMLFKNNDNFDAALYYKGLMSLQNIDNIRKEDFRSVLNPILEFIKYDTIRKS